MLIKYINHKMDCNTQNHEDTLKLELKSKPTIKKVQIPELETKTTTTR